MVINGAIASIVGIFLLWFAGREFDRIWSECYTNLLRQNCKQTADQYINNNHYSPRNLTWTIPHHRARILQTLGGGLAKLWTFAFACPKRFHHHLKDCKGIKRSRRHCQIGLLRSESTIYVKVKSEPILKSSTQTKFDALPMEMWSISSVTIFQKGHVKEPSCLSKITRDEVTAKLPMFWSVLWYQTAASQISFSQGLCEFLSLRWLSVRKMYSRKENVFVFPSLPTITIKCTLVELEQGTLAIFHSLNWYPHCNANTKYLCSKCTFQMASFFGVENAALIAILGTGKWMDAIGSTWEYKGRLGLF